MPRTIPGTALGGTDMTTTVTTEEGQVFIFVAVDHCTAECIGIHTAKSGDRFEALEPIRQGVCEHFGGFDRRIAVGLAIRHDHGSAYMSDDFHRELAFLGMTGSPSFVREPEGDGVAGRRSIGLPPCRANQTRIPSPPRRCRRGGRIRRRLSRLRRSARLPNTQCRRQPDRVGGIRVYNRRRCAGNSDMDTRRIDPPDETDLLLPRAAAGDTVALAALFARHRKRLRQMVRLRLDRRLQGRVDPSDVLQEAYLDLAEKVTEYVRRRPELPVYLWLRLVVGERMQRIHRRHLGAAMRDAGREVSLHRGACPRPARPRWRPSSWAGSPPPARR